MGAFKVRVEGSFELLTDEEWDKYLSSNIIGGMRIADDMFLEIGSLLHQPIIIQAIGAYNNKIGNLLITYALCRHYYDKGIPDDPWYKSPGDDGRTIQYMPDFKEEHWMRKYWFNHFAESIYLKYFSAWDDINQLINIIYDIDIKNDMNFKKKLMVWLKNNKPEVHKYYKKILGKKVYKDANQYRNDFTHYMAPSDISNQYVLKKGLIDWNYVDENNKLATKKVQGKQLTCRVGDYTNVKTVMQNIDKFGEFSSREIKKLLELVVNN